MANGQTKQIAGLTDVKNLEQLNDPNLTFKALRKRKSTGITGIAQNYDS